MLFAGGDLRLARAAEAAGVDRLVVDLERRGKRARQHGYHLETSRETLADLGRLRRAVRMPLVCRVNPAGPATGREVEAALRAGADVLMLPMFKTEREVAAFLAAVRGRAKTILLFETPESVPLARRLDPAAFDEAYVGLNDLGLAIGASFSYQAISAGLVDRVRAAFPAKPFGFGGVTVLDGGAPLPTRRIVGELARLYGSWTILRRAFRRDVSGRDMAAELARLRRHYLACARRSKKSVRRDQQAFCREVREIAGIAERSGPASRRN